VTSLLGNKFRVVGCDRLPERIVRSEAHIREALGELAVHGAASAELLEAMPRQFRSTTDITELRDCDVVIESAVEDFATKEDIFDRLESVLRPDAIVCSNTSAIPVSLMQRSRRHPGRFIGMHWGEPCHVIRFLEIIRGEQTSDRTAAIIQQLARDLGKDAVMVQKDVRGFITNRLLYALLREAFHLLETGVGTAEDIDRSFRNDFGTWATVAGPFRWLDLTGISAYAAVMEELLPDLARGTAVPAILREMVRDQKDGVRNGRGFYSYTPEEAAHWEKVWRDYTWENRALADRFIPLGKT
jgi:3-hydroxybutyryl-CoA dehydrogenase